MFLSSRVNLAGFSYFDDAYKVALQTRYLKCLEMWVTVISSRTRTTHAHDASRRAVPVRIAHVGRPCGAEMSEISQSSRTTIQLNRA